MFLVFAYRCRLCGVEEDRYVTKETRDSQRHEDCKAHIALLEDVGTIPGLPFPYMARLPAGTRTHFKFADTKLKR